MLHLLEVLRRRNAPATHGFYEEVSKDFRVGLTDIDLNLHLNNAKYLKYMDLARLEHMLATGTLWKMIPVNARPIIANTEISYVRELRTWQRFSISARILGVDEKYMYYEHRFTSEGKLCTHALLRLVCVQKGKSQPIPAMLDFLGVTEPAPALPEPVLLWKDMLDAKKKFALGYQKFVGRKNIGEQHKDVA